MRVSITIDGRLYSAAVRWTQPGAHVLTVHTVLPDLPFAVEVHSSFVGHQRTPVCVTHLVLGPVGADRGVRMGELDGRWYHPGTHPRACLGEHFAQLLELLHDGGYDARIHAPALTSMELR